jgi:hypothetical protein
LHSLYALYGDRPAAWLNTRTRFIQLLHVAYAAANERTPGIPRPLIVYSQHWTNDDLARRFVEDFPAGLFLHTIRDPISSIDSWYDRQLEMQLFALHRRSHTLGQRGSRSRLQHPYLDTASQTLRSLLRWDRAHAGMDARTRAVRFEDLHLAPEEVMRRLASWLEIPYRPCLLDSTFNGVPYVYSAGSATWVGANAANAVRRSRNINLPDRVMLFALLTDNFSAWNYPFPRVFHIDGMRALALMLLWFLPMRIEWLNARLMVRHQLLPEVRAGRLGVLLGVPSQLIAQRLVMMAFIGDQALMRLTGRRLLLKVL